MYCSVLDESRRRVVVVRPDLPRQEQGSRIGISMSWPVLFDRTNLAGEDGKEAGDLEKTHGTWRFRPQGTLIVQGEVARALGRHRGEVFALYFVWTRMLYCALDAASGGL